MQKTNTTFGKLGLITGATSGLGKELSYRLSKRGLSLILVAKDAQALNALCAELPNALPVVCDLSSPHDREHLLSLIYTHVPDLIINNAGIGLYGPILNHPLSLYQQMVEVNLNAILEISITAANALHRQQLPGTILNISSAAALFPYPTFAVYAASKAFMNHFSQAFDEEMKDYNIRILTSCPGPFNTPFRLKASQGLSPLPDRMTMSVEQVADEIFLQLDTQKRLHIINWRYRLGILICKLLPQRWLFALLKQGIKNRYIRRKPDYEK